MSARRSATLVMSPTTEDAAFIVHAIRELASTYRRNGATVPSGVMELRAHLLSGVTAGQAGPPNDGARQTEERVSHGPPLLIRYETAAQLLEVSVSTIKRLIKAGELHPVPIGGAARLRRAELDTYIANLNLTGDN